MKPKDFFSAQERELIIDAIRNAEKSSSGEIRVHVESSCHGSVLDRSAYLFHKLGMDNTNERNGVLFYLAIKDHQFSVIGDAGINGCVAEGFWDDVTKTLEANFKEGLFAKGLADAIMVCGNQLKTYFPYQSDDVNELPDDLSFGK